MLPQDKSPTDDSEDLLDDEIASSTPVRSMDEMLADVRRILLLSCSSCGGRYLIQTHALRRRKPSMFWRFKFQCGGCGVTTKTYRVKFLPAE